jgi:hypothetical protein
MRCAALLTLVLFLAPALADDKAPKLITPAEPRNWWARR